MKNSTLTRPLNQLTNAAFVCFLCTVLMTQANAESLSFTRQMNDAIVDIDLTFEEARELAEFAGLNGRQSLPPDIEREMNYGSQLPPCVASEVVPAALLMQLPYLENHEWLMVGTDLVLVATGSSVVEAVLAGVFE